MAIHLVTLVPFIVAFISSTKRSQGKGIAFYAY